MASVSLDANSLLNVCVEQGGDGTGRRSYVVTIMMTHKGYSARIRHDDQDGILIGRVAGIHDGVGFHADNITALGEAFREAVEDYLETCAKIGKEPQTPC